MKSKKRALCGFLLLTVVLASLASCGASYRDDVDARTLSDVVIKAIGGVQGEYYTADEDTYTVYFGESEAYADVEDRAIVYHGDGTNVDQIGVFRVRAGGNVNAVREMVQEYLDGQLSYLRGFAANYQSAEMEKLECAQLQVMGRYVVFSILSAEDTAVARKSIRDGISK